MIVSETEYTRSEIYSYRKEGEMQTNIVLDDKLKEPAQKLTGIKTKYEVVHEALRLLILSNEQA
jgi:Arc/MetJ family transcription regulator